MTRIRILGPRPRLPEVLDVLQELGILHLTPPGPAAPLSHAELSPDQAREARHLNALLADVSAVLEELGPLVPPPARQAAPARATRGEIAGWAHQAFRVRRTLGRLSGRARGLEEEHALILKYQGFFSAFQPLLENEGRWTNATMYHVLLKPTDVDAIARLRSSLATVIGNAFELYDEPLPSGEVALLVVVSAGAAVRVERLLSEARVQEIPVPEAYGGGSLAEAMPRMRSRLAELPAELAGIRRERLALARAHVMELRRAASAVGQRLRSLEALPLSAVTAHAFVLEGWLPAETRETLAAHLRKRAGDTVVVTEVAREQWRSEEAPVVLRNPRLFRPFEAVISLLPLPRYGTIDPTPFVAVFFPVFFGLMLGDIGYGLVLAAVGLVLHRRSRPATLARSVSEIIGPCALLTMLAGLLFGELFGDLGRRWFGLRPLLFDREEALVPFLLLAIAIGTVHILLGLILGVVSAARGHPREAVGRGAAAVAVVLIALVLLAAAGVLPRAFFTPGVVGLLLTFPVLIAAEGVVAPVEFLSTLGNVLSYARIMALGVASVMLAVVANRMAGMMGSAIVGVIFALLFHLVNFAIGIFSPTIHALRLHYVEFFQKFYSPGGIRYQPFGAPAGPAGLSRS